MIDISTMAELNLIKYNFSMSEISMVEMLMDTQHQSG